MRRDGGDVERAAAVAAGAAGVDEVLAIDIERRDALAHRHRRAGDLFRGLAFHPQRDEQRALLDVARCAVHDLAEDFVHLVAAEVAGRRSTRLMALRDHREASEEVADQLIAAGRAVRLGVELNAEDGPLAVRERHDRAVVGLARRCVRNVRHGLALDDERVIARGLHRIGAAGEEALAAVVHLAHLPVHRQRAAHDPRPERLGDGLMAEADAEERDRRRWRESGRCSGRRARECRDRAR